MIMGGLFHTGVTYQMPGKVLMNSPSVCAPKVAREIVGARQHHCPVAVSVSVMENVLPKQR